MKLERGTQHNAPDPTDNQIGLTDHRGFKSLPPAPRPYHYSGGWNAS